MQWVEKIVDEAIARWPDGEILVESGASPSGTYHFGHLREIITCDAILLEIKKRGRQARHIQFVDDLDALRKIPVNVPAEFEKYLGRPLCDIPSPDGSDKSYAEFFVSEFLETAKKLGIEMDVIFSHEKYRNGFFVPAIEKTLENDDKVRQILSEVSGHKIDDNWSPVQVMEDGYLKSRKFLALDKAAQTITYADVDGNEQSIDYTHGEVKLNWRVDWAARWWLLNVNIEPAGRDHSSAGGSFDTGLAIVKQVFGNDGPIPVPYDFVNKAGDTKKMSASKGTGISAVEVAKVLPPEVVRYFMLRFPPAKRLYFDETNVAQLIDEFAELSAKEPEAKLVEYSLAGLEPVVSSVPFSHLVASYQSALKDADKTLDIIGRTTEQALDQTLIKRELKFIDSWLKNWAPETVKFELKDKVNPKEFNESEKKFLAALAEKVNTAPQNADGALFHQLIYDLQAEVGMEPQEIFGALYKALIGKPSGPRAGWFLSILPREWLIKRLRLEA